MLTLLRLVWSAQSARHLITHDGKRIDRLAVAPKTVGFWVDQATQAWTDSSAHWENSRARSSGKPSGRCLLLIAWKVGRDGIGTCWSSWCLAAFGRRSGSPGATTKPAASYATKPQAQCSTAVTSARRCARRGTCESHERYARRHVLSSRKTRNSLHKAFSLPRPRFCQQVHSNGLAQFCGTTDPQTGFLEEYIFTDRSLTGSGALRRAGWVVVAFNVRGNLKAAAYGLVPSDVLLGQTSRDDEDYTAAMAVDPFKFLKTDCDRNTDEKTMQHIFETGVDLDRG